jgi:hypothetical protein
MRLPVKRSASEAASRSGEQSTPAKKEKMMFRKFMVTLFGLALVIIIAALNAG